MCNPDSQAAIWGRLPRSAWPGGFAEERCGVRAWEFIRVAWPFDLCSILHISVFADADRLSIFWFCELTVKSTKVPEFHKPLFCINNLFGLSGWC